MATKATSHLPEGYTSVTPYLICKGAGKAIGWYQKVLGAEEKMRMDGPGGAVMHAEVIIGGSVVMLADEFPEMHALSPETVGGTPVGLMVYVKDCDAIIKKAVAEGATVKREAEDQFYGDRSGTIVDPFGHQWTIGTHIEDVGPEEIAERMKAMGGDRG